MAFRPHLSYMYVLPLGFSFIQAGKFSTVSFPFSSLVVIGLYLLEIGIDSGTVRSVSHELRSTGSDTGEACDCFVVVKIKRRRPS